MKQFVGLCLLLLPLIAAADSVQKYDVDPSTGFRMERYRAPVPADISGGTTLDNTATVSLHDSDDSDFH